ncbi:M16 family metallopeptidase [Vitreoscilla stercoraria]|uniref:Insulinase family protein n=1 Tax=Vitreoscilla stercoraria TaxID=61 RepID=A0ABY4EAM9_VITST|nr:pitrilysin family protein [Vitreoscilla stercoraria]UOO92450.1 insulinase family protein [Vitreoscilla stercoraria]
MKTIATISILSLAWLSQSAWAQTTTTPSTIAQTNPHQLHIQSWHLKNGAKVLLVERHALPIVDINVAFDAGSRRDDAQKIGVANFAGSLMDMGAGKWNEEDIRRLSSDWAVTVSSFSDTEQAGIRIRSLSQPQTLQDALKLGQTILSRPTYPQTVLTREQDRAVLGWKQNQTDPQFLSSQAMTRLNYPQHPYGYWAQENEASIRAIKRQDLLDFHHRYFRPSTAVVSIVGDINRSQAQKIATELLADLPQQKLKLPNIAAVPLHKGQTTHIHHPASQTHLDLSLPVISRDDVDYFALLIGNYTLGAGGFDSLLMKELRDNRGFTYGAYSHFNPMAQKGTFSIGLSTQAANAPEALKVTKQVLADYIAQGPTEAQLQQAKNNIIGGFPMRFDTNNKLLGWLSTIGFYQLPLDYLDTYPQKVQALTTEQIRDAWQRRLKVEDLNVVTVGQSLKQ